MKAYLSRRYHFSASHRLHSDEFDEQRNQEVYGKCNNPHGHGHNYIVEVTVAGQVDENTGMVCNLGDLDGFMQGNVISRFDHSNLNLDSYFENSSPDNGKSMYRDLQSCLRSIYEGSFDASSH